MALVYGTRLVAAPSESPHQVMARIAHVVGAWARVSDPLAARRMPDRRRPGGTIEISHLGSPDASRWAWRLRRMHPDEDDPHLTWGVSLTSICEEDQIEVIVRLDLSRKPGALARHQASPAPPGCIAALINDDELRFVDAGRRLSTEVWVVDSEQSVALANLVRHSDRRLPVFAFTPRDEDVIDGGVLGPQVAGLAHIVLVKSPASWALDDLLPKGLNVYGGAARLWWPGVTDRSSRYGHQLWTGSVAAREVVEEVRQEILEAGRTASLVDSRVLAMERRDQQERTERLQRQLEEAQRVAMQARDELESRPDTATEDASARADLDLADVEEQVRAALKEDLEAALELAASYEIDAQTAAERAEEAEKSIYYLRSEVDRLRALLGSDADTGDELAGIAAEIQAEISSRAEIEGARLRPMQIGPKFTSTLEAHGPNYRAKAIKAAADIVIGAVGLLSRREDHELRTGAGANDPQRTRASDGAKARRCYIEQRTASARRLHYWVIENGSVELASVNVHDDMNIPE